MKYKIELQRNCIAGLLIGYVDTEAEVYEVVNTLRGCLCRENRISEDYLFDISIYPKIGDKYLEVGATIHKKDSNEEVLNKILRISTIFEIE